MIHDLLGEVLVTSFPTLYLPDRRINPRPWAYTTSDTIIHYSPIRRSEYFGYFSDTAESDASRAINDKNLHHQTQMRSAITASLANEFKVYILEIKIASVIFADSA